MLNENYLDNYLISLKEYIKKHPELNRDDIVMKVYIDLGLEVIFNMDFFIVNRKEKRNIYNESTNSAIQKRIITCNQISKAINYILNNIGISCDIKQCENDEFSHICNIIGDINDENRYTIDLQQDMANIQYHGKTLEFGRFLDESGGYVISLEKQRQIHEKIGYISSVNPYADEYIYSLKNDVSNIPDFYDKVDFVINNINFIIPKQKGVYERGKRHKKIMDDIFLYEKHYGDVKQIILYGDKDDKHVFFNGFYISKNQDGIIYIFSEDNNHYIKYSIEEFKEFVKENNVKCYNDVKAVRRIISLVKSRNNGGLYGTT